MSAAPLPLEVDAVVLDCDGLLAETESGWTRAETAIFAENGFGFGAAEKRLLIGGTLEAGGTAMADHSAGRAAVRRWPRGSRFVRGRRAFRPGYPA